MYKHSFPDSTGYTTAFNLFDSALQANEPSAIFAKAYMYYKGLGCTQSYVNALQLFRQGIDSNRADCMYFAGLCFINGYAVTVNNDSANYYIIKAASLGYKQANQILVTDTSSNHTAARGTSNKASIKKIITELRK